MKQNIKEFLEFFLGIFIPVLIIVVGYIWWHFTEAIIAPAICFVGAVGLFLWFIFSLSDIIDYIKTKEEAKK